MNLGLEDRVALVVGGASGIGAETARLLAASGARVMVADRNLEAALEVAEEVGGAAAELDVRDLDRVEEVTEETERAFGEIGVLVNCAGIAHRILPPDELDMEEWDKVVQIHLRGTYGCCRAVGARMARRGDGAIVNLASVMGLISGPVHAYGPAKAGIINMTLNFAGEWGPRGVRVNAVAPGFTHTPMLDRAFSTGTLTAEQVAQQSALGRLIQPREIAQAITFLASNAASAITGVTLPVDAGFLLAGPWAAYGGLR